MQTSEYIEYIKVDASMSNYEVTSLIGCARIRCLKRYRCIVLINEKHHYEINHDDSLKKIIDDIDAIMHPLTNRIKKLLKRIFA